MTKHNWPIVGNQSRLAELEADFAQNKLSHAYLFAGPKEVGKFTAAKFFANLILCGQGACGDCPACHQIRASVHPGLTIADKLWIENTEEDWETIAKSSNFNQLHRSKTPKTRTDALGKDDLTEIISRIHSTHEDYHVILIRRVERFTTEAANHLLKTLEEPPPRTIFLLTTDNPSVLPETIVSRCRLLQFGNVRPATIEQKLAELFPKLDETERARIVNFATGKPGRAVRLAGDPELLTSYAEYFRRLKNIFETPDLIIRLNLAEETSKTAVSVSKFLEALTYFLRSLLLSRIKQPALKSRYNPGKILSLLKATNQTRLLISHNVNQRLAVENLLLQI